MSAPDKDGFVPSHENDGFEPDDGFIPHSADGGASSEGAPQRYGGGFDLSRPAGRSEGEPAVLEKAPLSTTEYLAGQAALMGKNVATTLKNTAGALKQYADESGSSQTAKLLDSGPLGASLITGVPGQNELANIIAQNTVGRFWHDAVQPLIGGALKVAGNVDETSRRLMHGDTSGVPNTFTGAQLKKPKMDSSQYLARRMLEFYGGQDWSPEGAGVPASEAAQTELKNKLGAGGAFAAETATGLAGQGPLLFLPAGKAAEAGTLLGAVKNAAFVNSLFAAAEKKDPFAAAAVGAGLGGTVHMAVNLKPIARIQPDALARELLQVIENEQSARAGEVLQGIATRGGPSVYTKTARAVESPPSIVTLVPDQDGNAKLREVWAKYNSETNDIEIHRVKDTESPTPKQVAEAKKQGGWTGSMKGPDQYFEDLGLLTASTESAPSLPAAPKPGDTGGVDRGPERARTLLSTPLTSDNERTLIMDANGRLRMAFSSTGGRFENPAPQLFERGDVVTLHHAGGQIPGVRVLGVSADGSTIKVGHGKTWEKWPAASATLGRAEEEAAHFSDPANHDVRVLGKDTPPTIDEMGREVQKWGYVVPERLVARFGISPDHAAALAEELKDAGWLRNGEQGIYDVAKAPVEAAIDSATGNISKPPKEKGEWGFSVYWGKPTADGKQPGGKLLGPDPFHKGSYRVEIKPGVTVTLTPEEFNTARPVTVGNKEMSRLPAEEGITTPLPPGFTQPQSSSSDAYLSAISKLRDKIAKRQGVPGILGNFGPTRALWGFFNNDIYRGGQVPWSIRHGVKANLLETNAQHTLKALDQVGLPEVAARELNDLLSMDPGGKRDAALAAWVTKHRAQAVPIKSTLDNFFAELDADRAAFVNEGLDPSGLMARKAQERLLLPNTQYVRKIYGVHMDAEKDFAKWAEKQMPMKWKAAVRLLSDEGHAMGFQGDNGSRANSIIEGMLKARAEGDWESAMDFVRHSGAVSPKTAAVWQARKQMAPELEAVMGHVELGTINLAYTRATLKDQLRSLRAFKELTNSPYWSRGPRADMMRDPIPNEPKYGLAAGGYLHPDLAWILKAPEIHAQGFALAQWLGRAWKQSVTVLGGPSPWVNNIMRNVPYSTALGTFDPANPVEYTEASREAARLMEEYAKDPSAFGPASVVFEAVDYGAVPPGFMSVEGTKFKSRTQRLVLNAIRENKTAQTPWDLVGDVADRKYDSVKDAYDSIDQVSKLADYLILRKRALAEGMNVHDAAAYSASRVNEMKPNFSMPAPVAKKFASYFGYLSPFATAKMEDLRVQGNIAMRVVRDGQQGKMTTAWNLAKGAMFVAAMKGGLDASRRANGITDEDVAESEKGLPFSTRGFKNAMIAGSTLDSKGHVYFVDPSAWVDPVMAARGSQADPLWQRLVLGTVNEVGGQGAFQGPINTMAAATGFAGNTARAQLAQQGRSLPAQGDTGPETLIPMLAANIGPQLPFRYFNAMQAAGHGPEGAGNLGYTDGEMVSKFLGVPFAAAATPEMEAARNKQFAGYARDLKKDRVKGALQNMSNPEKQKRVLEEQAKELQQRAVDTFGGGAK